MFAAYTPIVTGGWQNGKRVRPEFDPVDIDETCIVSLVNAHGRPCTLRVKFDRDQSVFDQLAKGPCEGGFGKDLKLDVAADSWEKYSCQPDAFEIDHEAERQAGLPPLPYVYDDTLLLGQRLVEGKSCSDDIEIDVYTY